MNNDSKQKFLVGAKISAFSILFFLVLQNFNNVLGIFEYVISIFSPFIIGVGIAFVLNLLLVKVEFFIFTKSDKIKDNPKIQSAKRPVSLVITILLFFGILFGLSSFIIPQLEDSISMFTTNFEGYISSLNTWIAQVTERFDFEGDILEAFSDYIEQAFETIINFAKISLPKIIETTVTITNALVDFFIGFIVAIYLLASKEKMIAGSKNILYAILPIKNAEYVRHVYHTFNKRFAGFVSGQLSEALILGLLTFILLTVFQIEYTPLISVIIGMTNMIPIVGPFIGIIPSALILLMVDPWQALIFVISMIILQQIEGNIIYPKVVGDSIGLPGLWVLFSIIIGGELFGFPGILLGVPTFAVIYSLCLEAVDSRLTAKGIDSGIKKADDNAPQLRSGKVVEKKSKSKKK